MKDIDRALLTKELGKAQSALRAAFSIAASANALDVAKDLREQQKVIGAAIVKLNGGPVVSIKELIR